MEINLKGIVSTELWRNQTTIIVKIKQLDLRKSSSSVNRKKPYGLYSRGCIMNFRVTKFFNFNFEFFFLDLSFFHEQTKAKTETEANGFFPLTFFTDKNICSSLLLFGTANSNFTFKVLPHAFNFFLTCYFPYLKPSEKQNKNQKTPKKQNKENQ